MKITNLDTDLLLYLITERGATTTELAKLMFAPINDYELRKHDSKIRYRLERMRKKELLHKNGVKYTVNEERVFLTQASMFLEDIEVALPMGKMLVVYPKDDEIMMRTLRTESMLPPRKSD
ncbi:hypothetical protein CH330_01495 [candidate division WOR-3 bacterium JGI_Cruoil_03_51_56]|mgnify:CR=1 FL=1|uniref:Uncharacterized protein n=1 Tax=candidate division WOR-3 bacterium JGI_Cruoil_03_51_56 TaxID=1973747 RepID=A0A235BXJ4_UNCW3|nr:MAG: hypothetical protein CH330_01495 [candidate division WOR-3 bacterium JGI_Cruoil_03_51_56]